MPSQTAFVEIPVLPHVKDLLIAIYGPEPIEASGHNLPGQAFQFAFMSSKNKGQEKIRGEKIAMRMSHRLAPYYYKFNTAFSLGCYFEKQFNMLLFVYIEAQRKCGVATINAIRSFYQQYNINEEYYSPQAAHEAYRRLKAINS